MLEDAFSFVGGLPALALSSIWPYGLERVGDIGEGIEKNYDSAGFLLELSVHPSDTICTSLTEVAVRPQTSSEVWVFCFSGREHGSILLLH
jgi:hypothetical protein